MKPSTKRTLKKVFLNVSAALLTLTYIGNLIAAENAGQINATLGTSTSKTVKIDETLEEGYPRYFESAYDSVAALKAAGLAKVQEVEAEGIVLLKNDNSVLPLAAGSSVSLFGITVIDPVYGGTGSGAVDADGAPNYVDVFEKSGLKVANTDLISYYTEEKAGENLGRNNYAIGEAKWKKVKKNIDGVEGTDAFFVIGRVGGEGSDMTRGAGKEDAYGMDDNKGDYLTLNEDELSVLEGLKDLKEDGTIKSITVIINSANPISTAFLFSEDYGVDAALWVGSVGQTGLYAVGDVVAGIVNPSGSLPDTWWMDNMDNPVMNNFAAYSYEDAAAYYPGGDTAFTKYVVYQEGIYLGYKYTETRYEDVVLGTPNAGSYSWSKTVSFPFGYGLSYSSFEMSDMTVARSGEGRDAAYTVTVTVTNTGNAAGKKTVQIYAQKPYTEYDQANRIEKASAELVGYAKTQILAPGASETVTISVPEYYLTSFDTYGTGVYILDAGTYYLTAADNSHAAVNNILAVKGKTVTDGMTADGNTALVYTIEQAEMDSTTYSTSYGTGNEVSALFANGDMNRYEGSEGQQIAYYSRSDWEGTVTSGCVKLKMTAQMAKDVKLEDEDLPDAAGVEFPTMGKDAGLQLINMMEYEYSDPMWDTFMDQLTFDQMATLTCTGLRETAAVEAIGKPYTVDHNGPSGVTQKYAYLESGNGYAVVNNDPDKNTKGTCYPCNGIVAATFNDELVREVGELIGEDAMWAGYAGLYGTGLNIHRSPYSGRVFEYYSEDGMLTGLIDTAETLGIQSKGVYVYNKHFVINDQEENRAGIGTWCNEQALREIYLRAFELPIVNADAKCVMTSYSRLGVDWCGASYELLTSWLRGEAGMTGFAVSDMYDYSYMVGANEIVAGNDIPDGELLNNGYSLSSYNKGGSAANASVVQAMRESSKRVLYTVLHSRGMDGISSNTKVVSVTPWWQMTLNVAEYTLLALTAIAAVMLVMDLLNIRCKSKTAGK